MTDQRDNDSDAHASEAASGSSGLGNNANDGLPRTLEPESMDAAEEVQQYNEMDHQAVNNQFVSDLIDGGSVGPRVLDLGCGTALIPVLLAQRSAEVEILGVDSSVEMLDAARFEIECGGVMGRIHLEHADCKDLEHFEADSADTVISNSVMHHLAEPGKLVAQAVRILRSGGRLFVRDLFRPVSSEAVESLVKEHAGQANEFSQQMLRQSLHAALTVAEAKHLAGTFGIPEECIQMTSDRHWTMDWAKC